MELKASDDAACDLIMILCWAKRADEALAAFSALPEGFAAPDYVLKALERACSSQEEMDRLA